MLVNSTKRIPALLKAPAALSVDTLYIAAVPGFATHSTPPALRANGRRQRT